MIAPAIGALLLAGDRASGHDVPANVLELTVTAGGLDGIATLSNEYVLEAAGVPRGEMYARRDALDGRDDLLRRALGGDLEVRGDGVPLPAILSGAATLESGTTYFQTTARVRVPWERVPRRLELRCRWFPEERGHGTVYRIRATRSADPVVGRLHMHSDSVVLDLPAPKPTPTKGRTSPRGLDPPLLVLGCLILVLLPSPLGRHQTDAAATVPPAPPTIR